ncbi:multiple epidermal growth factor-like domains protein 11 [Ylistrum balloti]|uniref:multiple epidermal growth factor-like domains protein 11 n=1 Tax=Ylistrum balloti TaxID=509963 RepID=UPI002905D9B6|nr:multiple epidermal growth factor-like domains protein 11 [Ylistrum balloti]
MNTSRVCTPPLHRVVAVMSSWLSIRISKVFLLLLLSVPLYKPERNVALTGTAIQSTDQGHLWTANKAIDNCINQSVTSNCCALTSDEGYTQAEWRVDLGQMRTIQYITIYFRHNSASRFGGYTLFVSNSTAHLHDIVCYKDNSSKAADLQLNPTHQCPYVARYVTIYNYRENPARQTWYDKYAILELCEVQVFGCPMGSFGNGNCNSNCLESCLGGNCNANNGSCFYCFPGMFGEFCEQHCSTDCSMSTCEKETGLCQECVNGTYGIVCELDCSVNCEDKTCMKETGYCLECVAGLYGSNCTQTCPMNCQNECDRYTAVCKDALYGNMTTNSMTLPITMGRMSAMELFDSLKTESTTIYGNLETFLMMTTKEQWTFETGS